MGQNVREKGPLNLDLQGAVNYLYERKLISKDRDISDKVGLSASQVSNYVNGRAAMSAAFRKTFETVFHLKLADFTPSVGDNAKNPADSEESYRDKYIKRLENEAEFLKDMLRSSLAGIYQKTAEMWARQKGTGDVVLHSLERLEKKKTGELVIEADKQTFQIDKEENTRGNAAAPDN